MKLVYLCIGGAAGSLARFIISRFLAERINTVIPLGTLFVNTVGAFMLSLITFSDTLDGLVKAELKLMVATGFLGAFTTFSTLMYENLSLLEDREILYFLVYLAANIFLGFAGAMAGYYISTVVMGG